MSADEKDRIFPANRERMLVPWLLDLVPAESRLQHPPAVLLTSSHNTAKKKKKKRTEEGRGKEEKVKGLHLTFSPPPCPPVIHLTLPPRLVQY